MSTWQRLRQNLKYGLLAQSILSRLGKIGLAIKPYYVYKEKIHQSDIDFPDKSFRLEKITEEKIAEIADKFPDKRRIWVDTWFRRLAEGELGLILKHGDEPAGFTWASHTAFPTPSGLNLFELGNGETYLHDMVIAKKFRGSGIAVALRFASYNELVKQDRFVGYSASMYFNKPAIRFKEKIGSTREELRCEFTLFGKYRRDFVLKRYRPRLSATGGSASP